ncbi:hypothetical protein LAZ67_6003213 [Cordylochernes scorpioides]|uniref:CCHC-type domain-containing protein n=1 Tax=Cordylochernes scorpioides TaxID=51811 RepID=A0ABY6KLD1_9ARAC|nr:hypothetical protein LAZ67_6003213 [Cordylochernes scorpioides]
MNRLKKGRRPVRGQITKLINTLQLEDLCRDLHEWDEKVTEAMLDEEVTEAEQDKEYDERLRYDRLIKRMREELEKVLNPKKGVSPQPDETTSDTSNSTSRRRVLLSKRKLPEFGGDVREWITFWSRFEDIHNDEDLSDSDKYQYLVDCMLENSEAQQLVLSYPVSGKNYASVIKDLKERFGRDNMLIKVYVRDLLWLVIRSAQERKVNFKDLVTKLNSQIRHLSMLGVTTDKCADILYPVVESCLPEDVLISWQRSSEPEDLECLMKFLRREVNQTRDREMAYNKYSDSLAQPTPGKIETKKISFNARREIATTSGFMHSDISPTLREKFKCIICDNGHPSQDCRKGMKMGMDQKNEKIKSYKRCFKCLLPGHRSRQCSSDVARVNEMSNSVSTKACLETLLVKVWGPKGSKVVRAVIDSGSSQSYILEHIVKDLGVPIMGEEELDHEIFGGNRCISCPTSATNQIARCMRKPTFGSWARELASKKIQLSAFKAESDVAELLLGADINPKIATANMIRFSDDLIARETLLGWVVQGKTEGKFPDKNPNQVHNSMLITSLMTQEIKVSDLWSLENIGVMDDGQAESKKETDQAIMDKFRTEKKRLESGRYEVHLPWIEPAQKLKENKSHAEVRLRKMTEDLKKRGFYHHYNKIFKEWKENGIIERIHTTPVRPVFDASCKTKDGWSLNDCLAKGPNLLKLIPDIMLRFRLNKIGIVADIEKAFLQISVAEEDRQFLRFLWWEDGKLENLRIYQHKRVVFGVTSSPFLLAATLKLHLEQYEREKKHKSIDLLSPAGFNLREWQMGGPGIVNGENISVLGRLSQMTKRIMLSEAHAVFDPLGLFSPFTIVPKIILQQCWKSELKRDQPVPEDIVKKFVEWQSQIPELLSARIPRWVMRDGFEQASLHVFCDASQDSYATCIYLRTVKNKEVNVQLFVSKARVALKKKLTIPRLELMSCLIGSRLTKQVMKIISKSIAIPEPNIWFWTDSSTALRWIQNENPGQHLSETESTKSVLFRRKKIGIICQGDDKRINKFNAFTDKYGLYRIKSQLYFGEDDYDTRCPIVLPGENQVVKLLIRKEPEMMSHAGIQTTQQLVRRRFWILKGKRTIRSIISAFATCRRYNSKRVQTESIPIPATRIGSTPAFGVIGSCTFGAHKKKTVSTEGFLDTFRRFVARRGRPSIVYSDNGLNFVECNNLFKKVNWNDVLRYATVQRIKWTFNPLTAAFWEVDKTVSYEELQTVISEVESAMNSRPLTAISEEFGLVPITPAKFMCDNHHAYLYLKRTLSTLSSSKKVMEKYKSYARQFDKDLEECT